MNGTLAADGGSQLGRFYEEIALLVDGAVALVVLLVHLGVCLVLFFLQRGCMLHFRGDLLHLLHVHRHRSLATVYS